MSRRSLHTDAILADPDPEVGISAYTLEDIARISAERLAKLLHRLVFASGGISAWHSDDGKVGDRQTGL